MTPRPEVATTPSPRRSVRPIRPRRWLALGLLLLAAPVQAAAPVRPDTGAETVPPPETPRILAHIGEESITRAEVEAAASDGLSEVRVELQKCQTDARRQGHQVLEDTTRNLVRDRLLQAEAKARGLSRDQLLAQEVQGKVQPVTEEEARAFFDQNKSQIPDRSFEQVSSQIEGYLEQQRLSQAYQDYMAALEDQYRVTYELEPFRVAIDTAGEPSRGPQSAPVTIVEFSDFECPSCARLEPILAKVREHYGDKVRIVFKQFPLNLHPHARQAAEASLCAHAQGKFWPFHDAVFADQKAMETEDLQAKAAAVGLDPGEFFTCVTSGEQAEAVRQDVREGTIAGASGTPALYINGRTILGTVTYDSLAETIDDELARSARHGDHGEPARGAS